MNTVPRNENLNPNVPEIPQSQTLPEVVTPTVADSQEALKADEQVKPTQASASESQQANDILLPRASGEVSQVSQVEMAKPIEEQSTEKQTIDLQLVEAKPEKPEEMKNFAAIIYGSEQ